MMHDAHGEQLERGSIVCWASANPANGYIAAEAKCMIYALVVSFGVGTGKFEGREFCNVLEIHTPQEAQIFFDRNGRAGLGKYLLREPRALLILDEMTLPNTLRAGLELQRRLDDSYRIRAVGA